MQGRYGIDHFSRFLLVGALVCVLLSGLLRASALNYVSWILLIWMYYRMFSKNIRKRCEEERMYMDTKEKVVRFCKGDKSVISDSKTHKIYRCPHCRQKIRVPRGKGKIEITCPGSIKKIQGDSETMLDPASVISVTSGDGTCSERLILEPQDGSELTVNSLVRAQGTPSYGGRLEILDTENGLVLVNEIDMEEYLKKVIPSEMPSSYEKEALKAQAVCARTYAFMQSRSNSYSEYGAQIDDSTQFQVYNNVDPDEKTAQAVQETYGKMLYYNENPITAYYFSTSCGTTTNAAIWDSDPEDTPYLRCLSLQTARSRLSFASEEAFASFIKKKNFPAYDASYPLYRWNFKTNGTIIASHVGGVGKITGVSVTERGPGGVAMKLLVKGSEGETTISGQNAIRSALGDASLTLTLMDGKTSDGWSLLPSGFLAIEETGTDEQGVVQFRVYGGGYGHGVGMSQNGAQGMAKAGMGYEEILKYFYDGVTIEEKE